MLENRKGKYQGKHARQPEEKQSLTASLNAAVDGAATTPQKRKALWVGAFVLAIAALLLGASLTYSAFSANDHLKAVPVTGESQSLFASDVLTSYDSTAADPVSRNVTVDTSKESCSFTFKIYNCLLDDPNVFNDKEVVYTLSVDAKTIDGTQTIDAGKWSISPAIGSEVELPSIKGVINTYTITLDKDLVDKATFTIKATVDTANSPGTSIKCLAAKVTPAQRADVKAASATGAWVDGADGVDNYDAYNYRVTVTGKSQTITLTWGNKVELDPFFETNHKGCSVDRSAHKATFTAEPGSEIVNFYRVGSEKPSSWDDIGVSVPGSN